MSNVTCAVCPVCDEHFSERPTRCFRCGTDLREWWPLEGLLSKDEEEILSGRDIPTPQPPTDDSRRWVQILLLVVMIGVAVFSGFLAGQFVLRSTTPAPEASPILRYRIQKGDSAWRVAAALTGSGQNWQLLWPELKNKPIQIGGVLEVRIDRIVTIRQESERR
jgi:hypothetical protein